MKVIKISKSSLKLIYESLALHEKVHLKGVGTIFILIGKNPQGAVTERVSLKSEKELRLAIGKKR